MTTENAFNDARSPIDGYARNTGPSSAPAAAASAEPKANVTVWILPIGTPMSAAVSRSWNVARIAVPRRVFWMSSQASPISAAAVSTTKSRSGAMLSGPRVRGAVGNGCGIERATPPHASSSAFCIAIHTPIITSMIVSIEWPRSGRSSARSQSAPSSAPAAMAASSAAKKGRPASASAANAA